MIIVKKRELLKGRGMRMQKGMRGFLFFLCMSIVSGVLFSTSVSAEETEINQMTIQVELQEDGSGQITEQMIMTNVEGTTENFIEHEGVSASEISDFEVSANGQPLEFQEDWDSDQSREEKENEYGMIELSNGGIEFVWGIPDNGVNTYDLSYTIDDMVMQLEDGQSMNWAFFRGTDTIPDEFTLEIEAPDELTAANTNIALMGLEDAEWELNNGVLEAWKDSPLSPGDDIIVLLQFEEELFQGLATVDQTFEEQQDEALEGTTYNEPETSYSPSTNVSRPGFFRFFGFFPLFIGLFQALIFGTVIFIFVKNAKQRKKGRIEGSKEIIEVSENYYTRDFPYDGELFNIAFFLNEVEAGLFEDYFFSYLIKWAKEGKIEMLPQETGTFRKREEMVIHLIESVGTDVRSIEQDFWDMLERASDNDRKIYEGDLAKWSQRHTGTLSRIERNIVEGSKRYLRMNGYIEEQEQKTLGLFRHTTVHFTPEGKKLFEDIVRYKHFLEELEKGTIDKEEMQGVDWEQFMIYSCVFGHGEKIVEKLEGHYPEIYDDYLDYYPTYYSDWHVSMYSYRTRMRQGYNRGRSSSSGGGFSSGSSGGSRGGGGGGSRGGGGRGAR